MPSPGSFCRQGRTNTTWLRLSLVARIHSNRSKTEFVGALGVSIGEEGLYGPVLVRIPHDKKPSLDAKFRFAHSGVAVQPGKLLKQFSCDSVPLQHGTALPSDSASLLLSSKGSLPAAMTNKETCTSGHEGAATIAYMPSLPPGHLLGTSAAAVFPVPAPPQNRAVVTTGLASGVLGSVEDFEENCECFLQYTR